MRDNKTKVITMAALVIAIIGLSIGFAAFSSTLNIQTGANINPTDNFSVKFSKEDTSLVENLSVLPTEASTATGDSATINNQNNPTISGLSAHFTRPGQTVEYIFYVRNMGPYDAYLTDVRFNNAQGASSFRECVATGSNPVSNVNSMCNNISFKLELAGLATPLTNTSDISTIIGNNYYINKSNTPESGNTNSKQVKVTIEYTGDTYADGSFDINFGDVEMIFTTVSGYVPPTPTPASSDQEIIQGVQFPDYVVNSQGVITKYNGSGGDITIPSTSPVYVESEYEFVKLDQCKVAAMTQAHFEEEEAISACAQIKEDVESGKTTAADNASEYTQQFYDPLKSFEAIVQGYEATGQTVTVTSIGESAFGKLKVELTSVDIPSTVTSIGINAFENSPNLTVRIHNNQIDVSIGEYAFDSGTTVQFNDKTVTWGS